MMVVIDLEKRREMNEDVAKINVNGKTIRLVKNHEKLEALPPLSERKKRNIMKVMMEL